MAFFECLTGNGGGMEIDLTVECDSSFAGETITCTNSGTTLTAVCPSSEPYNVVFPLNKSGTWIITAVKSSGTFMNTFTISETEFIGLLPDGKTILPTDNVPLLLECAAINNKSYTTIGEVLQDSDTLETIVENNNAVDYLVRSTTFATPVSADSNAMTLIGDNDYCASTLLMDSTWDTAICNSSYFESVLNEKVPSMTSNTTPSGVSNAESSYPGYSAYFAFDGTKDHPWAEYGSNDTWIQYEFENPVKVAKLLYDFYTVPDRVTKFEIYGDGNLLLTVNGSFTSGEHAAEIPVDKQDFYSTYRMTLYVSGRAHVDTLQFYGRT